MAPTSFTSHGPTWHEVSETASVDRSSRHKPCHGDPQRSQSRNGTADVAEHKDTPPVMPIHAIRPLSGFDDVGSGRARQTGFVT
jgi:hypothetical protein